MLSGYYQTTEAVDCFANCQNLNAAIKGFLKNDATGNPQAQKFAKAFRKASSAKQDDAISQFIGRYLQEYEPYFFALARSAQIGVVNPIADEVIERFAEDFNETYEIADEEVSFRDRQQFEKILGDVRDLIDERLTEAGVENTGFLYCILVDWIFEPELKVEVLEVFQGAESS